MRMDDAEARKSGRETRPSRKAPLKPKERLEWATRRVMAVAAEGWVAYHAESLIVIHRTLQSLICTSPTSPKA